MRSHHTCGGCVRVAARRSAAESLCTMAPPSDPSPRPARSQSGRRFRDAAVASGLVTARQIESCEQQVAAAAAAPARADHRRWDVECANLLVRQGTLSRFQAAQLLAGRSKLTLGQYEIVDELGRGGMGQVFRARHALMGRVVAIKVLPRSKSTPQAEAAFQREIRMLARLDHGHLVRALDAGHDGKVYYLVTELIEGLDLRRQVLRHGPLDEAAAASVIAQAAEGLAYAHGQGLVHRDIKPSNILVTPDGRVKLLDLGLAGSVFEEETTRLGRVVGTMDYMSPEQIREPDAVGPPADIYSLGCTLYFALTGEPPFPGGTRQEKAKRQLAEQPRPILQLRPGLDKDVCKVVEAMMQKDPAGRIHSAEEVIERLHPWIPRQPAPMSRVRRRSAAVGGTTGSSIDGGTGDSSQAGQQATRGSGSETEVTWWGPRPLGRAVSSTAASVRSIGGGGVAGVLEAIVGFVSSAARCVTVAAVVGVLVAVAFRRVWPAGGGGAVLGWGAFGAALAWQVRAAVGRWRRRGRSSDSVVRPER
jgi:serine/threonine protein kinase